MRTHTIPSPSRRSEISRPTVTALQETPVADRGETVNTTTTARMAGIPTNRAAVCPSP